MQVMKSFWLLPAAMIMISIYTFEAHQMTNLNYVLKGALNLTASESLTFTIVTTIMKKAAGMSIQVIIFKFSQL